MTFFTNKINIALHIVKVTPSVSEKFRTHEKTESNLVKHIILDALNLSMDKNIRMKIAIVTMNNYLNLTKQKNNQNIVRRSTRA